MNSQLVAGDREGQRRSNRAIAGGNYDFISGE